MLAGGPGDDTFIFRDGDGNDTIDDFTAGPGTDDRIDLSALSAAASFADVQARALQDGPDALIDFGGGDSIRLVGINVGSLDQDDFVFVT